VIETTARPEIDPVHSKRLALISGTLLAVALGALGAVYMQEPAETAAVNPTSVSDPLAARRAAGAAVAAAKETESLPADAAGQTEAAGSSGDGARLLEQYRQAVEARPQDADARTSLAQVLVRLKRTEEALPHFERAIALDPQRPAHYVQLGNAFSQLQRWGEAVDVLRRAQQLQPADPVTTLDLAKALQRNGNGTAAVDELRKAIGLAPNDASIRFALAESFEAQKKWQEASQVYSEYLKIAPAGPNAEMARSRIDRLSEQSAESTTPPGAGSGQ
jgi:Flp pilus assembly protein TadD